jgi:chaperonin GroEL
MLERKDRIEDALNATKAAVDEGIVAGCGLTLYRISQELEKLDIPQELQAGYQIIINACKQPFTKIMLNSGNSPDVIIDNIDRDDNVTGYNVNTGDYCNMINKGIIDPVKVTKCAFKNALSVASMFTMLECALFDITNEE